MNRQLTVEEEIQNFLLIHCQLQMEAIKIIWPCLEQAGFESLEEMLICEESLLQELGLKAHHARKIVQSAAQYKWQNEQQDQEESQINTFQKFNNQSSQYFDQPQNVLKRDPQEIKNSKFVAQDELKRHKQNGQQNATQYLIYESFNDKGSEYKMSKTRLNEEDFTKLISQIKEEQLNYLQVVGYYGDFERSLTYASAFLDTQIQLLPHLEFDEGLLAIKHREKIALIYKINPIVYFLRDRSEESSVSSSQVSTYIRYMLDVCEAIFVTPPKLLKVLNDNTTPYQEQINPGYYLREVNVSQIDSLKILKIPGSIGHIQNLDKYMAFGDNSRHFPSGLFKNERIEEYIKQKFSTDFIEQNSKQQQAAQKKDFTFEQLKQQVQIHWPKYETVFQNKKNERVLKQNLDKLLKGFVVKENQQEFGQRIQKLEDQYFVNHQNLQDQIKRDELSKLKGIFEAFFDRLGDSSCIAFGNDSNQYRNESDPHKKRKWLLDKADYYRAAKNQKFSESCDKKCGNYPYKVFQANYSQMAGQAKKAGSGGSSKLINWVELEKYYYQMFGEERNVLIHKDCRDQAKQAIVILLEDFIKYNDKIQEKYQELRQQEMRKALKDIEPLIQQKKIIQDITAEIRFISANMMNDTLNNKKEWSVNISDLNVLRYKFDQNQEHGHNIKIKNMHFLNDFSGFILFQNTPINRSSLYFFNTLKRDSDKFENRNIQPSNDSIFAFDNDSLRFFYCDNIDKKATLSIFNKDGHIIDTKQLVLYDLLSENKLEVKILDAILLPKNQKALLLNQDHCLYEYNFKDRNFSVTRITKSVNDGIHKDKFITEFVQPQNYDEKFLQIQATSDGSKIILRATKSIELYDLNWSRIQVFQLNQNFLFMKVFTDKLNHFLIIFSKSITECHQIGSLSSKTLQNDNVGHKVKKGDGNPILNYFYEAFKKYGPHSDFLGCPSKTQLYFSEENNPQNASILENYFKLLEMKSTIQFKIAKSQDILKRDFINQKQSFIDTHKFEMIMASRVPLHLATIENSTLIPLQNGQNISEAIAEKIREKNEKGNNQLEIKDISQLVNFGIYQNIMNNVKESIKVVSIVGRQSSGKSYGLNRIFGTRFNVAATRCTDGIWMSLVQIYQEQNRQSKVQYFLVMDCEGLFSERRNEDEEIKLCLVLSAISDMMILNQDLSFNRNLNQLFHKFSENVGKIQGNKLFKGKLMMLIRDVRSDEAKPAYSELKSNIEQLQISRQDKFFGAVFQGKLLGQCLSYYQQKIFGYEINNIRDHYFLSSKHLLQNRWDNGKDLVDSLKIVLSQVFLNDGSSIDDKKKDIQCENQQKQCEESFFKGGELIKDEEIKIDTILKKTVVIEGKSIDIEVDQKDIQLDEIDQDSENSQMPALSEKVMDTFKKSAGEKNSKNHDDWTKALDDFISSLLDHRIMIVMQIYIQKIPNDGNFENIVIKHRKNLEKKVKIYKEEVRFCSQTCKKCNRKCSLKQNHGKNCTCKTDHRCHFYCDKSLKCKQQNMKCDRNSGHKGTHLCAQGDHNCTEQCSMKECMYFCTDEDGHAGAHNCGNKHPCLVKCLDIKCQRTCKFEQAIKHDQHICGEVKCTHNCSECDQQCSFPNHLHQTLIDKDNKSELKKIADNGQEIIQNYHICANDHQCKEICQIDGVCEKIYDMCEKSWVNEFGTFKYQAFEPRGTKIKCEIGIAKYLQIHNGPHKCDKPVHGCTQKCPECSGLCEKEYGHPGLHGSKNHINKQNCVFVSDKNDPKILINDNGKKREYKLGESCNPEQCRSSCQRKGRAHIHLKKCLGGDLCHEKINPSCAKHALERYKPFIDDQFDKMLCQDYWNSMNWESPLDEALILESKSCNFYCGDPVHGETKKFCSNLAWHKGCHVFNCDHPMSKSDVIDVIFCMDATGSMSSYIEESKKVARKIINDIQKMSSEEIKRSIKFGFIAYTDHQSDYKTNEKSRNLAVTKVQALTDETQVQSFIDTIRAGGGDDYAEAVLDGLNDSVKKVGWRKDSLRFLFHIADAPPHGKQFHSSSSDSFPEGCPCGLDFKKICEEINKERIKFRMLKIGNNLNQMASQFRAEITDFEDSNLKDAGQLNILVSDIVVKEVQAQDYEIIA
ncbi:UNKNOWN [Stylonychia lemnae]|uniref:VWFA domain-containing protein n=1 Tax=Stylonychia lemnae TaxID=5949 RepID=A0A078APR7_STYLE|nr:UNKNOWN [Stylonychia lemnae]|eukprot:CDW83961.1 UNKNOWN [Stylonychia lemnae]